jgi:subtilisin family serine protease
MGCLLFGKREGERIVRWPRLGFTWLAVIVWLVALATAPSFLSAEDPSRPSAAPDPQQQALFDKLQVGGAWKVTRGDPKVVVGVIDNGFDFFHPDLEGQLQPGYYYSGGYHPEVYDNLAHGTLVASLIVGRGRGEGSVCGLAPGCKVLTACQGTIDHKLLKLQREFFRDHPDAKMWEFSLEMLKNAPTIVPFTREWATYQVTGAAEAIRYLTDRGVRVINFSGGLRRGLVPNKEAWAKLEEAFAYAAEKNVVIVLSAGNDAACTEDYPGDDKTVIIAGATLLDDKRWEQEVDRGFMKGKAGSNFGKRLTCMAPVENLLVCVPHDQRTYSTDDGPYGPAKVEFKGAHDVLKIGATSCAAPVVSALAALVASARPDLDAPTVVELIKRGCVDLGDPGFDIHTGHGRVNFARTLQLAVRHGQK